MLSKVTTKKLKIEIKNKENVAIMRSAKTVDDDS
jgi:hypothetical protein